MYIPAAGPPVFLDPELININFQEVNIFSSPFKFKNYLVENIPELNIEVPLPGSTFNFDNDNNIEINRPFDNVEAVSYTHLRAHET